RDAIDDRHRTRQRDLELTCRHVACEAACVEKDRAPALDGPDDARDLGRLGVAPAARPLMRETLGIDAGQTIEESPDVVPAPQFAVGHDRETGLLLLEDRETNRIVL